MRTSTFIVGLLILAVALTGIGIVFCNPHPKIPGTEMVLYEKQIYFIVMFFFIGFLGGIASIPWVGEYLGYSPGYPVEVDFYILDTLYNISMIVSCVSVWLLFAMVVMVRFLHLYPPPIFSGIPSGMFIFSLLWAIQLNEY